MRHALRMPIVQNIDKIVENLKSECGTSNCPENRLKLRATRIEAKEPFGANSCPRFFAEG